MILILGALAVAAAFPLSGIAQSIAPDDVAVDMDGCLIGNCGGWTSRCHFYGGAAAVWIQPRYESSANTFEGIGYSIDTFSGGNMSIEDRAFDTDWEITPRVWLGWEAGNGCGVRVTYWQYDHSPATLFSEVGGSSLQAVETERLFVVGPAEILATHGLDLETLDIEATQVWNFCGAALSASAGVRYVEAVQTSVAVANSLAGDVGVDAFETSFTGWGPTLAVEAHRPLCEWFGVFANARQSIVFGEESTSTFARQAGGGGASAILITHENDESLPITEVQVGGEVCCRCGIGAIVLRGAYEAQLWQHAGGPFNNTMDLTLQGASVSAGLIY